MTRNNKIDEEYEQIKNYAGEENINIDERHDGMYSVGLNINNKCITICRYANDYFLMEVDLFETSFNIKTSDFDEMYKLYKEQVDTAIDKTDEQIEKYKSNDEDIDVARRGDI